MWHRDFISAENPASLAAREPMLREKAALTRCEALPEAGGRGQGPGAHEEVVLSFRRFSRLTKPKAFTERS